MTSTQSSQSILDSISSIKRSWLRFFSGTMLSRISGMLRDVVLAFCFGTHEALAALFIAFRLSQLCRRLFGEGALQSAFIPVFEDLRAENEPRAFQFFRDLTVTLTLFLLGFVLFTMCGLEISTVLYDWGPKNRQIIHLMAILMPSLLFICLFGINSSLLQCQKRYFTVGIAPCFFNIFIIVGSYLFMGQNPNESVYYLAIFLVIGCMFQWLATLGPTIQSVTRVLHGGIIKQIKLFSPDLKRLLKPLALGMLGVGASQLNNAVDSVFSRYSDLQGPAQLWFGLRLLQLPLALFGIAVSGALLPPLSRSIQANRTDEYRQFLDFALRRVFCLLLPCAFMLYIFGTPLINCIYGRGDFQLDSILTTTGCLHGYAFGLLPMGIIIVLAPAFYATKDFITPAKGAALCLILNCLFNATFVFILGMQAQSVAIATSISSWINIIFLYLILKKRFGPLVTPYGMSQAKRLTLATVVSSLITWQIESSFFITPTLFSLFHEQQLALPTAFFDQMVTLAVPTSIFCCLLAATSWLFKADDLLVLLRLKKEVVVSSNS